MDENIDWDDDEQVYQYYSSLNKDENEDEEYEEEWGEEWEEPKHDYNLSIKIDGDWGIIYFTDPVENRKKYQDFRTTDVIRKLIEEIYEDLYNGKYTSTNDLEYELMEIINNLTDIINMLSRNESNLNENDFNVLQDIKDIRSYYINQQEFVENKLKKDAMRLNQLSRRR